MILHDRLLPNEKGLLTNLNNFKESGMCNNILTVQAGLYFAEKYGR